MINNDQLKVLKVVFTMFWQSVFSVVVIIAFFKVLNAFISSSTILDSVKLGSLELLLIGSVYWVFKYWFPVIGKGK